MNGIFEKLYDMTAFSNIVAEPQFLVMLCHCLRSLVSGYKETIRASFIGADCLWSAVG